MDVDRYAISINQPDGLIVATLVGRWSCETVDRFKVDLLAAGSKLMAAGIDGRDICILIDTRMFEPQALDVVAHYAQTFAEPRFQSERIAVVYKSTLQKMQTRRMAVGTPRFFEQEDEAFRWLRSFGSVATAGPSATGHRHLRGNVFAARPGDDHGAD